MTDIKRRYSKMASIHKTKENKVKDKKEKQLHAFYRKLYIHLIEKEEKKCFD